MLTTSTPEREHKRGESTLYISSHMIIGKFIYRVKERQYLPIILQETYNRFIKSCKLLVWFISPRIVSTTTIKHITTAITTLVLRYSVAIREAIHLYHQRSLCIIF